MAQKYSVSTRTILRVVKAHLGMKLFKYRKMYLLNEATRKPASVMVWGVVVFNGKKSPLLRIPDGVQINKIVYMDFLKTKVLPWIQEEFDGVPVCFQQDGAPAHTAMI
ncbi:Putative transposable element, partial [Caligus rogercresseyi]